MSLPVDAHTPCYGKGELFDSRHPADHQKAAALCKRCPLRGNACKDWLEQTMREYSGGPEGTWNGEHINPASVPGRPRTKKDAA